MLGCSFTVIATLEMTHKIFVQVKQLSMHNPCAKIFGIDFATALQAKCPNVKEVRVKLSQPISYYASGPAFKLRPTHSMRIAVKIGVVLCVKIHSKPCRQKTINK